MNRAGWVLALAWVTGSCGASTRRAPPQLADQVASGYLDPAKAFLAELQSEILDGYERDEPPDLETNALPQIGAARIGVGPGDFMVDQELVNASSRWPLLIGSDTRTSARSKRLRLNLAKDQSAAWAIDEVSWRIEVCGRTLTIPLRLTALYAHDGDRWVPALEHLSTGALPSAAAGTDLIGRTVVDAEISIEIASAAAAAIAPLLRSPIVASPLISTDPEAVLLGPQWSQQWTGADLLGQSLVEGTLTVEGRRIGVVGRNVAQASVAYWVGTLVATSTTGLATRLRATFVLERQRAGWVTVQGHVSAPVDDEALARSLVGSALVGLNPLTTRCEE
jgi:hypothetical protein